MRESSYLRTLSTNAADLGVTIPEPVGPALAGLAHVTAPTVDLPGQVAGVLAALASDAKAIPKALSDAADRLTKADAQARIVKAVHAQAHAHIWRATLHNRDTIAAAFGAALTDQLATLTEQAPTLPGWLTDTKVPDLAPDAFAAYHAAASALPDLDTAWKALSPLYVIPSNLGAAFTPRVSQRLAFVDPGNPRDEREAWSVLDALDGRGMGGSHYGAVKEASLFWPAAVAAAGGRFTFATPSEHTARANRLAAAARRPQGAVT